MPGYDNSKILDDWEMEWPEYEEMDFREFIACVNALIYTPDDGVAVLVKYGPDGKEITMRVTNWWTFMQEGWSQNWSAVRWYNK